METKSDEVDFTPNAPAVERLRPVRLIIAGTRGEYDLKFFGRTVTSFLKNLMEQHGYHRQDIEILSGDAPSGADRYAIIYANTTKLKVRKFPAAWDDLTAPNARIKTSAKGKRYNASAGFDRNLAMAKEATHLLAFWDGKSSGTEHMISVGRQYGLVTAVITIRTPDRYQPKV